MLFSLLVSQEEVLSHEKYFITECEFRKCGGGIDARHEDDRNGDLANVAWTWRVKNNKFSSLAFVVVVNKAHETKGNLEKYQ